MESNNFVPNIYTHYINCYLHFVEIDITVTGAGHSIVSKPVSSLVNGNGNEMM